MMETETKSSSDEYDSETQHKKNKKTKTPHRKQKYRKEWEAMPEFKYWLTKDSKSDYNAKCSICNKIIVCELTTIKRHGKTQKHKELQSNISEKQKAVMNRFVQSKGTYIFLITYFKFLFHIFYYFTQSKMMSTSLEMPRKELKLNYLPFLLSTTSLSVQWTI